MCLVIWTCKVPDIVCAWKAHLDRKRLIEIITVDIL